MTNWVALTSVPPLVSGGCVLKAYTTGKPEDRFVSATHLNHFTGVLRSRREVPVRLDSHAEHGNERVGKALFARQGLLYDSAGTQSRSTKVT
jgi:hypothetical protein